ncbi:hypothetical protein SKAU_G00068920 [Synaphobranchus kaupii]|uniref:Cytochrome P450 n=1 Tax=Synaphobranchus kaupii TaxID=118154 RepID=A0A9Q1G6E4_SYNKA|nr:hypothetical protein SKAU_G00068920 [Synaphobranchus kaupii]
MAVPLFEDIFHNNGLVASNGYMWKQQRRFALMTLKNFGVGKKSLESSIQAESKWLSEALGNEQGQPFDPQFVINNAISNVICCLVFGDRFEYTDRQFQDLLRLINEAVYLEGSSWVQLYNAFPWIMRRIPGPHRKIFEHWDKVLSFVRLKIKEHKNDWDPSAPRDYIDCFLAEMEKWKDDADAGFTEENLSYCTLDLFVAGTETTSTTLNWGLLFMNKYPDVQEKVQAEIDHVIGHSRPPSMADRPNMPYTDAVIHEIQRMGNIIPLNVFRMAVKDTKLGDYIIPKGTMVLATLMSVLFDESEWENPHTFNPGHFLDAEGNFRRRDAFMPFSAGKRVCLGEQLARMELFLFFTSLLQRFTFSPPPGVEPTLDYILKHKSPKRFPPGPWSLPFVGDLPRIDSTKIHFQLAKFAEQYGDIFSIHLGTRIVVLNGLKRFKEALIQHGENFVDRPSIPIAEDIIHNNGLVLSNGYVWKQQRRFALMTLKNFGVGKKSLESSIEAESKCLSEALGNEQGQPFDPLFLINNAISNVICCLVFGDRFEYTDRQFQDLLKLINEAIILEGSSWAQLYNAFPWIMRRIPGPHRKIFEHWDKVLSFVRLKIKEHKNDWDPSAPRDYIDCFLAEMEKWKDDADAGFTEENLCYCTLDLFVAGTETTSTTLNWGLLFMIKYPDVQEKVQAEIDHVIGQSRPPSMADRPNMPYTDAVIHEIQRMGNIIPLNVARMAVKDTKMGEYIIPKGTMVLATLMSVLFDESEWETPHTFNPGHFLDAEGNFRRRDAFMPFSAGKRACPGEQLARMELFLFFTSLLQRFTFSPPPGALCCPPLNTGCSTSQRMKRGS